MTTRAAVRIAEEDALVALGTATNGAACPVHVVGPLANHLIGPVSAIRPDFHPVPSPRLGRSRLTVDGLIAQATDARGCSCPDGFEVSDLVQVNPQISLEGAFVHARPHTIAALAEVERAIWLTDGLDAAIEVLDPRVDALILLCDLVRSANGGQLNEAQERCAEVLLESLAGRTRWHVQEGHSEGYGWPVALHMGVADEKADHFLRNAEVVELLLSRVLNRTIGAS